MAQKPPDLLGTKPPAFMLEKKQLEGKLSAVNTITGSGEL